jgi:tetratricopeptide (TPR) repeat protein
VARRRIALAVLLAAGLASQAFILAQQLASDPLARTPVNDARVYWEWAGEIAHGTLVGATPFLSAPLYPYCVGILRALGGGLATTYVVQARCTSRRWDSCSASASGASASPRGSRARRCTSRCSSPRTTRRASSPARCSSSSSCLLWDRMLAVEDRPGRARIAGLGLVPRRERAREPDDDGRDPAGRAVGARGQGWSRAGLRTAAGIAALAAGRDRAGDAPQPARLRGVDPRERAGRRHLLPRQRAGRRRHVPRHRGHRGEPTAAEPRRAIAGARRDGRELGATSSYFFRKGVGYWTSDPRAALVLFGRKLWFFLSARHYGDIYVPTIEREDGLASRLALAPLPTAWLVLPGLLALALRFRDRARAFPEALLVLAPLLTVLVFWYSPRYRMPAVPVLAGLAGSTIAPIFLFRSRGTGLARAAGLAIAWLAAALSGAWNAHAGFDPPEPLRPQHQQVVGSVLVEQGRLEEAERRYRAALAAGFAPAGPALADVLRRLGRPADALAMIETLVREQPGSAYVRRTHAVLLAEAGRYPESESEFRAALAIEPNDWESLSGLGNVLHATGRIGQAIEMQRAAIAKNPGYAGAHYNLGFVLFGEGGWTKRRPSCARRCGSIRRSRPRAWSSTRSRAAAEVRIGGMRSARIPGRPVVAALAAILLVVAGLGAALGACSRGPRAKPAARVLLVGIDGVEWKVLRPLLAAGKCPNLRGLMERGTFGRLPTMTPTLSPSCGRRSPPGGDRRSTGSSASRTPTCASTAPRSGAGARCGTSPTSTTSRRTCSAGGSRGRPRRSAASWSAGPRPRRSSTRTGSPRCCRASRSRSTRSR